MACTIVTCAPNELMATLHHGVLVILAPATAHVWLDPAITEPERLLPLLGPYPAAAAMVAYPVSTAVNWATSDSPQLILPI